MSLAAEDLLRKEELNSIEPSDTSIPEGFKQYIEGNKSLEAGSIRNMIYSTHDADKIREFTEIYADVLISRAEIEESAQEAFMQKVIDGYELTYNEGLYEGRTYGQMKRLSERVKNQLKQPPQTTLAAVQSVITEQADGMYASKEKGSKRITSFTIRPVYIVLYETETLEEQVTTEGFGVFEIISKHRKTGKETRSTIELRSYNFHTASSLRDTLRDKKVHGAFLYGSDYEIGQLGEYLFFEVDAIERTGISMLGIKRMELGQNVVVTPKRVYDINGNEMPDMVYVRDEVVSIAEIMKLQGMTYSESNWRQTVLPLFIENVLLLHKRSTMITVLGWLMSIPFETVVRINGNLGGFPHLMVCGVNGGGKTGLIRTLMSFLGYDTNPEIGNFGTQFANSQAIGTSYHIPVPFDEFRPHEWIQSLREAVNRLLRESYNRGYSAKGQKDLSTRRFDYRNPIIFIGQMGTSDQAITERVIPVDVDVNFLKSKNGKAAKETYHLLNNAEDKCFWTGYLIWCAKQDEAEVLAVYEKSKQMIAAKYPQLKEREVGNYAVVSLGLYYFKKMADEYGLDCHYSDEEIYDVVDTITEHAEATIGNKIDELWRFLNDLAYHGNTYGNNRGNVFGIGKTVMVYQPTPDKKDVYGKEGDKKAEVRGRKVLLVKIPDAIQSLHSIGIKNKYDEKMLMPITMSYFQNAQTNNGDGLVLAPQGYRVAGGRYTAFNWEDVEEMFSFVEELQSDANVKQAATELVRSLEQEKDAPNEGEEPVKH
jgi:nucleoid DNA-binding protein